MIKIFSNKKKKKLEYEVNQFLNKFNLIVKSFSTSTSYDKKNHVLYTVIIYYEIDKEGSKNNDCNV